MKADTTDQDEKAKAVARVQLSERAATAKSRTTQPGAFFVSKERAGQVDERGSNRQENIATSGSLAIPRSTDLDKDAKLSARLAAASSNEGVASKTKCEDHLETSKAEASLNAKVHVRQSSTDMETKPGAFAVTSSGKQMKFSAMQNDISAKMRAGPSIHVPKSVQTGARVHSSAVNYDKALSKIRRETSMADSTMTSKEEMSYHGVTEMHNSKNDSFNEDRNNGSLANSFLDMDSTDDDDVASKLRNESILLGISKSRPDLDRGIKERNNADDAFKAKIQANSSTLNSQASFSKSSNAVSSKIRREEKSFTNITICNDGTTQANCGNPDKSSFNNIEVIKQNDFQDSISSIDMSNVKQPTPEEDEFVNEDEKVIFVDHHSQQTRPYKIETDQERVGTTNSTNTRYHDLSAVSHENSIPGVINSDGLVIAVAVEDVDDDIFIPSAIEYDPDSKPPIYKNRRFRLYGFLVIFIIVVVTVGAVVGVTLSKSKIENDAMMPTAAPSTFRESFGIQAEIERVIGTKLLSDPESPYSKALQWITYDDPFQLTPEDTNFIQRYTASYFYFATTTDGPWASCNPPNDAWNDSPSCMFKQLSGIFPMRFIEIPSISWLSNSSECIWSGITCDDQNQVRTIDLQGQNLTGVFPVGIYQFSFLQSFSFTWNELRGQLPSELVQMKHLVSVEIHYNMFTGTIPNDWWLARNLQRLNLSGNMIVGSISSDVGTLKNLKGLFLFDNGLTGTLPSTLGNLNSLTFLRISRNQFTGQIPNTISGWKGIEEIWLHDNSLTSSIPSTIGDLNGTLTDLRLRENILTGKLPEQLYDLTKLARLDLWNNSLSGTISSSILNFANLNFLRINDNIFSGEIPTTIANLTQLSAAWLDGNNFVGSMPAGICALKNVAFLMDLSADCIEDADGIAELECAIDCCNVCCNANGSNCVPTS